MAAEGAARSRQAGGSYLVGPRTSRRPTVGARPGRPQRACAFPSWASFGAGRYACAPARPARRRLPASGRGGASGGPTRSDRIGSPPSAGRPASGPNGPNASRAPHGASGSMADPAELESLLTGDNAAWIDALYSSWVDAPGSVDAEWAALFERWERPRATDPAGAAPASSPGRSAAAGRPGQGRPWRGRSRRCAAADRGGHQLVPGARSRRGRHHPGEPLGGAPPRAHHRVLRSDRGRSGPAGGGPPLVRRPRGHHPADDHRALPEGLLLGLRRRVHEHW